MLNTHYLITSHILKVGELEVVGCWEKGGARRDYPSAFTPPTVQIEIISFVERNRIGINILYR